jgi:hypothetical protein
MEVKKEKAKFGVIKATSPLSARDLLYPIEGEDFAVSYPAFGSSTYSDNLKEMQGDFSCLPNHPKISFREPTTRESILAASYDFENLAKPQIFDPAWLQAGRIVRTSEGVFANPPKDKQGEPIMDEKMLKSYLDNGFIKEIIIIYYILDLHLMKHLNKEFKNQEILQKQV